MTNHTRHRPHRKHHAKLRHAAQFDPEVERFQELYNRTIKDGALGKSGPHGDGVDGIAGPRTEAAKNHLFKEYGFDKPDSYQRLNLILANLEKDRAADAAAAARAASSPVQSGTRSKGVEEPATILTQLEKRCPPEGMAWLEKKAHETTCSRSHRSTFTQG